MIECSIELMNKIFCFPTNYLIFIFEYFLNNAFLGMVVTLGYSHDYYLVTVKLEASCKVYYYDGNESKLTSVHAN